MGNKTGGFCDKISFVKLGLKLTVNTLSQLIGKALTTSTTLLVSILIAHTPNLGAQGYGEFISITSFVALFYLAVDFGINAIFVRELTRHEEDLPSFFRNLLSLRIVLSLVVIFISLALLSFLPYSPLIKLGIIIASLTIFNQALQVTANAIFQIKLRYDQATIAEFFASATIISLVFLTSKISGGLLPIVAAYVLGGFVRVLVSFYLASRFTKGIGLSWNSKIWQGLLIPAVPLGIVAVFSQIVGNIDKVVISLVHLSPALGFNNAVAVGIYGLAYKIFEVILVLPTFILNTSYPMMVKKRDEHLHALETFSIRLGYILLALGFLSALIGWIFAPVFISFFKSGSSYFSFSTAVLRILSISLPIFFLSALTLWLTITLGKQRLLIFVYGFAALVNFVLNLIFVPQFGYMASAFLTIFTELIILALTLAIVVTTIRSERRLL